MFRCEMKDLDEVIKDLELRIYYGEKKWKNNLDTLLTVKTMLRDFPKICKTYERKIEQLKEELRIIKGE